MNGTGFHLAQPHWLWLLLAVPAVLAWLRWSHPLRKKGREYLYADAELLPHLTGETQTTPTRPWPALVAWSLAWSLMVVAMAGPRWDYRRITAWQPAVEVVVLLDISASMQIQDVRPSRLARAKQEIQDLLRLNPGLPIGLVAFATVAHVVAPLTQDTQTLARILPSLDTSLVRLPGSRLGNALEKAALLFRDDPDQTVGRHLLLITDGDFDEPDLEARVARLRDAGIHLHVLGVGTPGGGPIPYVTDNRGQARFSYLNKKELARLAEVGGGLFQVADYHQEETRRFLDRILAEADSRPVAGHPSRIWNERFHLPLLLALPLLLWLFGPRGPFVRGVP